MILAFPVKLLLKLKTTVSLYPTWNWSESISKRTWMLLSLPIIFIYHKSIYARTTKFWTTAQFASFSLSDLLEKEVNCKNRASNIHFHNTFFLVDNSPLRLKEALKDLIYLIYQKKLILPEKYSSHILKHQTFRVPINHLPRPLSTL